MIIKRTITHMTDHPLHKALSDLASRSVEEQTEVLSSCGLSRAALIEAAGGGPAACSGPLAGGACGDAALPRACSGVFFVCIECCDQHACKGSKVLP